MNLTKKQTEQIQSFQKSILEQNQSLNLISRKNPQKQWELLLEQGLLSAEILAPVLKSSSADILDIGSGNGFPGLLFAMLFPKRNFYLCERIRKKAEFLKNLKHKLTLTNAHILCQSAEKLNRSFDLILSQASLPLEKMTKLLQKVLSVKGQAFLWQTEKGDKERLLSPSFQLEVFKTYKFKNKNKLLLKVQKIC